MQNKEEYTAPFDISNQLFFCGVPFRLDTYNGCSHQCSYCFVRKAEINSASRNNRGTKILSANPYSVKHDLNIALDTKEERESATTEWLRHRVPIHWGGMSDPFQECERKYKASQNIMQYLSWYNYPTVISTKGILLQEPVYLQLLKEGNYAVQCSLISDNETFMSQLEPGAPTPKQRLKMLETLANNGIWTAVRIQPMIPNSIVEQDLPNYIKRLASIGVKFIVAEGYKAAATDIVGASKVFELAPEAKKEYLYSKSEGFEYLIPTWRKLQYVKVLKEVAHQYNIKIGCGDNDLRDFGDVICCCGVDELRGFENFWRYQASQAAFIAKTKGFVSLDDMQQFWHGEKTFAIHNQNIRDDYKKEFGKVASSPKFAVDYMWNQGGAMSPECIFSMHRATKLVSSTELKLVYEYRDPTSTLEKSTVSQQSMF